MDITKQSQVAASGAPTAAQLEAIQAQARKKLTPEEVYVFSVRLCDDQVDRDFEKFDTEALPELARLFVGKTGICDHQWSSQSQICRIFETQVVREEQGSYIRAWAYMRRGGSADEVIADIEAGIKKEVSVGCSVAKRVCSVCGAGEGCCQHVRGQMYGDRLCFTELREPVDAYEWSFVAVPAQREAGVVKRFGQDGGEAALLRKQAALGRKYLQELRKEVVRLAMLADDGLDGSVLGKAMDRLEEPELLELKRGYEVQAARRFPAAPQLRRKCAEERGDETVFLV